MKDYVDIPESHYMLDLPGVTTREAEDAREARWARFENDVIEFAKDEGWPAVLRAVSRAMDGQKDLF